MKYSLQMRYDDNVLFCSLYVPLRFIMVAILTRRQNTHKNRHTICNTDQNGCVVSSMLSRVYCSESQASIQHRIADEVPLGVAATAVSY